jgi:hypothetical protein
VSLVAVGGSKEVVVAVGPNAASKGEECVTVERGLLNRNLGEIGLVGTGA